MKGVYYYEDRLEITFMWLFKDGRVLFIGRQKKPLSYFEDFTEDLTELNFASGKFILISESQIRMLVNDENGRMIVKGEIINESIIRLEILNRETNFIDKKEFHRYVENGPIDICYKGLSPYSFN